MTFDPPVRPSSASAELTGALTPGAGLSCSGWPTQASGRLTDRELQVLARVGAGDSNKQIARALFVSTNTVKFHLKNLYRKLGVGCRTRAALVAYSGRAIQ
ncbi:response regulator transcription factor [Panacagrimonas sp.]|uniref:response regulator transcription factor n=1 Tax=Panacagrimonas sp. TaxID=2480088 RepID=UPI003B522D2A